MQRSDFFESALKKARKITISDRERKLTWQLHHGPHAKEAPCPMCGIKMMQQKERGGWQCAHIVAEAFCRDPHSIFHMVPCCTPCNAETGTRCIIEVLWERHRVDSIKQICANVFRAIAQSNPLQMSSYDGAMWKMARELYGSERHSAGGGISRDNERDIYRMLAYHQVDDLQRQLEASAKEMRKKTLLVEQLVMSTRRT